MVKFLLLQTREDDALDEVALGDEEETMQGSGSSPRRP